MSELRELDALVVDVIIDNHSDSYSSRHDLVSPEMTNVLAAGATELSGTSLCCAQLGLALMLTADFAGSRRKLLFDTGPEGAMLLRNAKNLGVAFDDVEAIALSHGHWDHMGGLLPALDEITGGRRSVQCHVNSGMFMERAAKLSDGKIAPFELVPSAPLIARHGGDVVEDAAERFLLDGAFYLSGEIPRVSDFEKGRADHLCRESKDHPWRPDPLILDERYLAAHVRARGLIVFSSCSHAGVINVLHDVTSKFAGVPLYAVFGGLHLVGPLESIIPDTVSSLRKFNPQVIVPGHCTGWRAVNALVSEFGEQIVVPSAVGSRYTFR